MLQSTQVADFERNGYVLGGRVLDDAQLDVLRGELERVIANRDAGGRQPVLLHNMSPQANATIWQIVNIWQASDAFRALVCDPRIGEAAARLMQAGEVRVWHDQIQYKPAGIGGVNMWHQDWPYWGILSGPSQLTAWVALDDVDEDNGCMSMVPGSHRWGRQIDFLHKLKDFTAMPAAFEGHPLDVRPCPVPAGSVHFHHALTWHGSSANTSARPRRALAIHLMTGDTRFLAAGHHVMKPFVSVADGEVVRGEAFPVVWPAA